MAAAQFAGGALGGNCECTSQTEHIVSSALGQVFSLLQAWPIAANMKSRLPPPPAGLTLPKPN